MKISIYGSGYVGLVAATCFAEGGNDVICLDINEERIRSLSAGKIPFFEPGLSELVIKNQSIGRLKFISDYSEAVKKSLFHFIGVGTPPNENGAADLSQVFAVAGKIGKLMNEYKIIVDKSTVPPGTAEKVRQTVADELQKKNQPIEFSVVSNPEFLKEGSAVKDFFEPDRVVIGTSDQKASELMQELYQPYLQKTDQLLLMDPKSAEMTKYTANAFLATKISFINEISNLCDKLGVDIDLVRQGIGTDIRIGYHFLNPGVGYGGSCFPKDVQALIAAGKENKEIMLLLNSVEQVNCEQKNRLFEKISAYFDNDLSEKQFAVWGLSFKPQTDDMREAPSITGIDRLTKAGAKVCAYDPVSRENAAKIWKNNPSVTFNKDPYQTVKNADALVIFTEWNEFKRPDFDKIKMLMKKALIFDGRNIYAQKRMQNRDFDYISMGRPQILNQKS